MELDWHLILGHPGQKTQDATLKLAGIKGYKSPSNCETYTKTKITKSIGHSSLRHSSAFAEAIHLDLVGGQKSLAPTSDNSALSATWFLLAVDEHTSWKWAWPIYSKKTLPTCINNFLQHLRTKFGKVPKCLHTDSGTEFSYSELQQILLSHGIEWRKSSSYAPEQNGITERNVRTVIEKMRALHLLSGIPLCLWPVILPAEINLLNIIPNSVAHCSAYHAVFHKMPKCQISKIYILLDVVLFGLSLAQINLNQKL
ncbi:hypothetical protein K3495_g8414 [Podosphaera aphanis]|nr:hypothetical protein K3495_g8414 [Podosphaera aphanis]